MTAVAQTSYTITRDRGEATLTIAGTVIGQFRKGRTNQQLQMRPPGFTHWLPGKVQITWVPKHIRAELDSVLDIPFLHR